jgi:DNA-binding transcriptional MerR regulator
MEPTSRIPEKLFFRIGEVCELIKVQPHVLRYWETEFPMLSPQKNRAGQRVYRRKDVEMVMRIRDLLYEEKFTIAGAKKRLIDEGRGNAGRARQASPPPPDSVPESEVESPEPEAEQTVLPGLIPSTAPLSTAAPAASPEDSGISPQTRLVLRVIKRDLEDLLTRLNTDASIDD